ncbi:nucleoside diphosphate kinase, mitochondrial isoform X2 [Macaca thibetana thibetana]|uniref:nucleoside diphosphate kinase, mitochondrial isoform X2 n=1 Tax=Macaca fascicularis TaxID=9541 RepID=UPI001E256419|nr:nucleoside diphosphate kinase, mitochondrial isoform X2 [Macaca fascicularis]XP_050630715.1 nucleoside diphosphate kinase, mitochondrial isoform X2 [Macaca thibetana thibetana]
MGGLFWRSALRGLRCGPRAPDPSLLVRPSSGGPSWTRERTLVAVKPDGVQRRLVGDVIQRFERRGFTLVGMKMLQVWEGYNVVRASRAMIGHTDSAEAAPGTIRGDFSVHISSHRLAPLDRGQQGSNRWSLGLLRVHMKPEPHLAPVTGTGTSSTPATLWRGPSGRSSCGSRAVSW